MKIAFTFVHMKIGGIRQSLLNLLNALKDQNHEIDLYIMTGNAEEIQNQLSGLNIHKVYIIHETDIYCRTLSMQRNAGDRLKKIAMGLSARLFGREKVVESCIWHASDGGQHYDVAISYSNGIWTNGSENYGIGCESFVLNKLSAERKIAWIHSNPVNLGFTEEICRRVYDRFDRIVNVSNGCKEIYDQICPEHRDKSVVVHNLCNTERVLRCGAEENPYSENKFRIVTVARLDNKSKRLDRIAEVCDLLKKNGYEFEWHVVGDGSDRGLLEQLIEEKNLQNYLIMEGMKSNPYPYVKNADLYVCTSDYEAFAITVREAMILGIPAVTTPISSAQELIENHKTGIICSDFTSLAVYAAIKEFSDHPEQLKTMTGNIQMNSEKYKDSLDQFNNVIGVTE